MKTNDIAKLLEVNPKYVRKYRGKFRWHHSYYWGVSASPDRMVEKVKNKIPSAVITDSGNHFHSFVGGAKSGSAQDSFLWVEFTV